MSIRSILTTWACLLASQVCFAAALNRPSGTETLGADTVYEGGILGTTGAANLQTAGFTATFAESNTLHLGDGGRINLLGTGIARNLGIVVYSNSLNVGLAWQASTAEFINEGVFRFVGDSVGNNGGLYFYDANGKIINSNGTVEVSSGNTHNWGQNAGTMICYGGTIRVTNGASSIKFDQNNYDIYDATFETYSTSWIRLRRSPGYVSGTSYGNRPVQIGGNSFATDAGGTVVDIDGLGVQFGAGTTSYALYLTGGTVMENRGLWTFSGSVGAQHQPQQGGTFLNTGTVRHFNTSNVGIRPYNGSKILNAGTWVNSNSIFYCDQPGGQLFSNLVSGTFISYGTSYFFQGNANFGNAGTLEVRSGTMSFNTGANAVNAETMSGGVLRQGTWKALGGNINFGFTTEDITEIGTNATVILGGTSTMDELDVNGGNLARLYGTLGLHGEKTMSVSDSLETSSSTAFEFGLGVGTATNARLSIGDSSTLQGPIHVVDIGNLQPGWYTVIDFSSGELTNGGIAAGTFTTEDIGLFMEVIVSEADDTVVIRIFETPEGMQLLFY